MKEIFTIRREERVLALVALAAILLLNGLFIARMSPLFMQTGFGPYWKTFIHELHLSGYDPLTYLGVTDWDTVYNVYRHPLLPFFIYPLYVLNMGLQALTGVNCVQYVVALPLVASSLYSQLFLYRILRSSVGLQRLDATLLTWLFFSLAYVMLSVIVPDHFTISMCLLLLTLYLSGRHLQRGTAFGWWQSLLLFLVTAGVTLSNGVLTFCAGLWVNGRRFFRPKYLLLAIVLPAIFIWSFSKWEYRTYVLPKEKARAEAKLQRQQREQARIASMSPEEREAAMQKKARRQKVLARQAAKTGKPMKKAGFLKWTDISTSRTETLYENMFGESLQFHQQYFLGDVLVNRPVFVRYDWALSYVVEAALVMLMLAGIWLGRKSRFLWLCLAFLGFNVFIHIVLGFGINEIYIMSPHWVYVLPIAMGFVLKHARGASHRLLQGCTGALALYLTIYNGVLLVRFLLSPIQATL